MAKLPMSNHVKQLHKRFMPANIVIAVVALIAGFCVLFMPWFDLRIQVKGSGIAEIITQTMNSATANASDDLVQVKSTGGKNITMTVNSTARVSSDSTNEEDAMMGVVMTELTKALSTVEFEIPLNMYPMKMVEFANESGDLDARIEKLGTFANSMIGANGAGEFLTKFVNELTPAILKAATNIAIDTAITEAIKESGVELTPEQEAAIEEYKDDANKIIDSLTGENPNTEQAKQEFSALVERIATEQAGDGEEVEIPQEEINKVFDELVNQGINPETNTFDMLYLLENFDMSTFEDMADGDSSSSSPEAFVRPMAADSMDSSSESYEDSSSSEDNAIGEVLDMLKDPSSLITTALASSGLNMQTMETIQTTFSIVFWVVAGAPAVLYFLLALCATLRIFLTKKRVRLWYVKIHGFFSAFFIVVCNVVASNMGNIISSMGGGMDASVMGIFNAFKIQFLGSGVVTAICYAILVLGGWFYYNRIKRQIKRARKAEKRAYKMGTDPVYPNDGIVDYVEAPVSAPVIEDVEENGENIESSEE